GREGKGMRGTMTGDEKRYRRRVALLIVLSAWAGLTLGPAAAHAESLVPSFTGIALPGDGYGAGVAVDGDTAVAGSAPEGGGAANTVAIFQRGSKGWSKVADFLASSGEQR